MFNVGFSEFMVIGVIALLVIGPKQLPEVARVVGRLLTELKKATQDLSGGLLEVTKDVKTSIDETKSEIMKEGHKIFDDVTNIDTPKNENSEKIDSSDSHESQENEKIDGK